MQKHDRAIGTFSVDIGNPVRTTLANECGLVFASLSVVFHMTGHSICTGIALDCSQ